MVDRDAGVLRCVEFWHSPHVEVPAFERDTRVRTFSKGIGMPGRVWASDSTIWIPDVTADHNFPRAGVATQEGLRGAIGFPIHNEGEVRSILEFFSREVRRSDEQLTEMMSSIASQISQFIERRSAESQSHREQHDRRVGREIQQGLLPKIMPRLPGFAISGKSLAPNIVGGDCFDFIPFSSEGRDYLGCFHSGCLRAWDRRCLATRSYLRGIALTGAEVGPLFQLTNQCLSSPRLDLFVTAFLMRLDASTRSLSYTSAGHLPGYVLDSHGQTRAILHSTGIPLGIDGANEFPASTVSFEPGDLILLVTDGITEAASSEGELFGMERALQLVRQHHKQTPDEIVSALFAAVNVYCNNNYLDDLTAVIIKVDDAA